MIARGFTTKLLEWPIGSQKKLQRTAADRLQLLDQEIERLRLLIRGMDDTWDEFDVFNTLVYFRLCKVQQREMRRLARHKDGGATDDAS